MSKLGTIEGYVVDAKRLVRTRQVEVLEEDERGNDLPPRHYMAHSASSPNIHYCCTIPGQVTCDGGDWEWQNHSYGEREEVLCKHLLACYLHEGNEKVVEAAKKVGIL